MIKLRKVSELPKKLTADDLELLLAGKRHLQTYPRKKKNAQSMTADHAEYARGMAAVAPGNSLGLSSSLYSHPTEHYHKPGE